MLRKYLTQKRFQAVICSAAVLGGLREPEPPATCFTIINKTKCPLWRQMNALGLCPLPSGYWVDPGHLGGLGQSGKSRAGPWAEWAAVGKARAPVRASRPACKQTAISSLASAHPHPHSPAHTFQGCAGRWFPLWAWAQTQPTGQNPDPALAHPSPQGGAWCPGLAALLLAGRRDQTLERVLEAGRASAVQLSRAV